MQNQTDHPLIPEGYYHIYNRANGNDRLFISSENYRYFLQKYGEYISPVAHTFCYCLMPNHFHFLVRIKKEEEVRLHAAFSNLGTQSSETSPKFGTQPSETSPSLEPNLQKLLQSLEPNLQKLLQNLEPNPQKLLQSLEPNLQKLLEPNLQKLLQSLELWRSF